MTTLQDALDLGQGTERPFRCPKHDDRNASASVNVLKGVWYCYVCFEKGHIDKKKAPTLAELGQMMEPEKNCRIYPEIYLDVFTVEPQRIHWSTRFPDWLVWWATLGEDAMTGEATFPVRTPEGRLAGVGRRQTDEAVQQAREAGTNPSRYKYPMRWSASRVMHSQGSPQSGALVLVEGAADAISLWEVGIPAYAVYGSGLHLPQVEYVKRFKPSVIVLGMDADDAGERGAGLSMAALADLPVDVVRVTWPEKDPAECTQEQRISTIASVVGQGYVPNWQQAAANSQTAYAKYRDELNE